MKESVDDAGFSGCTYEEKGYLVDDIPKHQATFQANLACAKSEAAYIRNTRRPIAKCYFDRRHVEED
eukprot:3856699-Lingulodinium_polyedra.AAC.1